MTSDHIAASGDTSDIIALVDSLKHTAGLRMSLEVISRADGDWIVDIEAEDRDELMMLAEGYGVEVESL